MNIDLRDYFAGQYIAGIMSNPQIDIDMSQFELLKIHARDAYNAADVLLEQKKISKDAGSKLTKEESQWLEEFERQYKRKNEL